MLCLLAIIRLALPPEPPANDLLAHAHLRLGHAALTVIALIYVLLMVWQH